MQPIVTEGMIARQPPEAQAIIRLLLATIAELEAELDELRRQAKGKTPQNSSLPPSTQHPHARPPRDLTAAVEAHLAGQPAPSPLSGV